MKIRWYGLYLGDKVIYEFHRFSVEGIIVKLFSSDNNKGIIIDSEGNEHEVVCEYCKRIPRKNSLLSFYPLVGIQYTVLTFEGEDISVSTYLGEEVETKVIRIIENMGDEIDKVLIYAKENPYNQSSLYQEIPRTELIKYYKD